MFRDNDKLHWQRIAEGHYRDCDDDIKYRAYQRSDGLELRVLLMNNQYKLLCKNACRPVVTACSSLPLFSFNTAEENVIGMSDYTPNPEIIVEYLQTIDPTPAFAGIRAEILCFLGIKKQHFAERAKDLEEARIHFLEQVEKENETLRARLLSSKPISRSITSLLRIN